MEHFYQNIEGWFNFQDIYSSIVKWARDGAHLVEIGAWYGKSTAYMAVEIANSNKVIHFDTIDTWEGSEEHQSAGLAADKNIQDKGSVYECFLANLSPAAFYVHPIRLKSLEASKLYADGSLDFVFLDAAHDFENVSADINAWFPKVKPDGFIAGHDYSLDWPGVVKAVQESPLLDKQHLAQVGYSWLYKKPL